ncbi:carcinoembryonic antigen-related cell adhesion molecule 20 [Acomys russatus]|uniref:carcinoembryonic antigen-related cell adhesion molecule 20 n=1 Tax=Acomys russatus TaxID=60746 RepID=UPI0021E2A906|nr:carcinoembryonic antigen-related cell adhesion molecule 20 [Acomys russatus]
MGPAGFHGRQWIGILLSASLLTAWNPPAAARFTRHADLLSNPERERALLDKPTLSAIQSTVSEQREMAIFYCDTKADNATIHWVVNNSPLVLNERMMLSADDKTLTILTVDRGDAGSYQCNVWHDAEVRRSNIAMLGVNYGPDPVTIKLDSGVATGDVVEVMEGHPVNFWVETQSCPTPAYTWYLPTDSIQSPTTGTLTIHAVSREHEGMYRCLVNNSATRLSQLGVVQVQVLEKMTAPYIDFPALSLVENETSVSLTCKTSHQGVGVQWFLRGQPLRTSEHLTLSPQNRTLTIHGLQRDDTGPYECEVWNWGSRARSTPLRLTINYGPYRVDITQGSASGVVSTIEAMLNSSLTLHCWGDSEPGARYQWTHEHSSEVHTGELLAIDALRQEHQGIYSCIGSNNVTGLARSASVLVKVVGPQLSSLSPGAVAGIVTGILVAFALVTGLGCFLYRTKDRWIRKKSADNMYPKTTTPTSVTQSPPELRPNKPKTVYDNMPKPQEEARGKKMLPPLSSVQSYERESPSAAPEGPRKLPSQFPKQPLVPPVPDRNLESNYQKLLNPRLSVYCKINPSA